MIQVVLIHKQRLICEAVKTMIEIEADIEVIAMMTDERDIATHFQAGHQADVILVDIDILKGNGFHMMSHLKDSFADIKIIYVSHDGEKDLMIGAIVSGADGILYKKLNAENIIYTIRNVYNNITVISGEAARILAAEVIKLGYDRKKILSKELVVRGIELTDREKDVALLVMDKLKNKEIADELFLSIGTTKNYMSSIYDKLNLRDRNHVIAYLRGIVSQTNRATENVSN